MSGPLARRLYVAGSFGPEPFDALSLRARHYWEHLAYIAEQYQLERAEAEHAALAALAESGATSPAQLWGGR